MNDSPRQRVLRRWERLKQERSTWITHWRELSDQIQPRRSRFLQSDRNKGDRRNDKIINATPRRAARILASGMMAGVTSPARPWFRLTTPDPELAEFGAVREWLHVVEQRMRLIFERSNIYNGLHGVYTDLATYGTAALHLEDDPGDVIRGYLFPVGQYALATSPRQQVDTVYRELSMTVGQLVEQFGLEACSDQVRRMHERGAIDEWVDVLHVIEPKRDYQAGKIGPAGMPWRSFWMEQGGSEDVGFLRESGYREFPVLAVRWEVTGEDVYGSSPGMDALGDCKALQQYERRKAQVVDKIVTPPMQGPSSLQHRRVSLLPGDFTPVDTVNGGQKIEPAMVVHPSATGEIREAIREHEERINAIYYADLWLSLLEGDRGQMTAREVAERHEEKMLQLGPVMERLQDELLDPLIDRAFSIMSDRGHLPPPPDELQGVDLRVEYISILAQAQKLLGVTAIERFAGFVGGLANLRPDALDKIDIDETIDTMADSLGVPPKLVLPDDQVAAIREERAAREQAQAQGEAMLQAAQGAKDLAGADMGGDSALNRLLGAYGAAPPAAGAGR